MRAAFGQRPMDGFKYRAGLRQYVIVPETQDPVAAASQVRRAQGVAAGLDMLAAVELDDQARLDAGEIDDVRAHRMLAAELASAQAPVAQVEPDRTFGVGHLPPEVASEVAFVSVAHPCAPAGVSGNQRGKRRNGKQVRALIRPTGTFSRKREKGGTA